MSRKLLSLCLLLTVSGCSDATKKGSVAGTVESSPTTGSVVVNETPITKSENHEPVAVKPMESETPAQAAAEVTPGETSSPKDENETGLTTKQAFAEAQKLLQKNDLPGVVKVLERALPGNPDDLNLLMSLAQLNFDLGSADPANTDYERYLKAGQYVRRAIQANPAIVANPRLRKAANPMYYNEACALARDNQADQAMKSLEEALQLGYTNLAEMDMDKDLESVRALAGYAEFKTKAEQMIREQAEQARLQLEKEIDELLADNKPFNFNFELTDTDAKPIAKADFIGKVLIVDVWGTWCPPCRMEIPHFVKLQNEYGEAGLAIVGLNQENAGDPDAAVKLIQDFREQNGMNYRCALVGDDTLPQIPDFGGFPTTMFFDRSGKVRAKVIGYHDYEKLELIVRKLLEEKVDGTEAGSTSDK